MLTSFLHNLITMDEREQEWRSLVVEWTGVAETFEEITNRVAEIMVIQFPTPTSFEVNSISIKAVISTGLNQKDQAVMTAYRLIREKKKGTYTEEDKRIAKACANVNTKINRLYRRLKDSIYGTPILVEVEEPVPDAVFYEVENPTPIMSRTTSLTESFYDTNSQELSRTNVVSITTAIADIQLDSTHAVGEDEFSDITMPANEQKLNRYGNGVLTTNRQGSGTERNPQDLYETSKDTYDVIGKMLLLLFPLSAIFFEPFVGNGKIIQYLRESGFMGNHIGRDLYIPDVEGKTYNSLIEEPPAVFDCSISNPPYNNKYETFKKFYEMGKPFILLLPLETLAYKACSDLFKQYGVHVVVITGMPKFLHEGRAVDVGYCGWFCGGFGNTGITVTYTGDVTPLQNR